MESLASFIRRYSLKQERHFAEDKFKRCEYLAGQVEDVIKGKLSMMEDEINIVNPDHPQNRDDDVSYRFIHCPPFLCHSKDLSAPLRHRTGFSALITNPKHRSVRSVNIKMINDLPRIWIDSCDGFPGGDLGYYRDDF